MGLTVDSSGWRELLLRTFVVILMKALLLPMWFRNKPSAQNATCAIALGSICQSFALFQNAGQSLGVCALYLVELFRLPAVFS